MATRTEIVTGLPEVLVQKMQKEELVRLLRGNTKLTFLENVLVQKLGTFDQAHTPLNVLAEEDHY